jgi:hypothetical protein
MVKVMASMISGPAVLEIAMAAEAGWIVTSPG